MTDVAANPILSEESAPTSSRNKVKQRVADAVKNKLTQLNVDDAENLSNRITEMLAEGYSKEKLNEELTKLVGADKLKSSFIEWLYGYTNVFFPPTPALSEKDEAETEEKTEGKKKSKKETKTKRRSSQSRRSRSGSKSSVSSIDTDKSSKSNKAPLSPPASPSPAQDKQTKEKAKRRLSRSSSSLDLANKVQTEVMAQAIAIAAVAESNNNAKHSRERSSSISSNRSVERRNSFNRERKNSVSSNSSNTERVRCQYWPECSRGDQCKYWHPKELCKKYPNCPAGDKCLYIHPASPSNPPSRSGSVSSKHNRTKSDASSVISTASDRSNVECKFGANCNRPDCKYSHPSPAAIAAQIAKKATAAATETLEQTKQELQKQLKEQAQLKANAVAKTNAKSNVPCHFFPNCKNPDCPYQHPSPSQALKDLKSKQSNSEFNVPCRYDGSCTRADCKFIHTKQH
ncbi:hypothetical protein H8356DRAFT_1292078 [Neocallimastix lanati (nom. inval.)]|nr:hypothetical protein H8356DRAFT_1292078 [Neocallimastix sp. JGI-2020a]